MGGLLQSLFGRGASAQNGSSPPGAPSGGGGFDSAKALQFTQDRWNDLKNAYVVYHQAIWETLLFYANQSWIEWDEPRKIWQPQQTTDEWVPRPRINRFSPTIDAVTSNFSALPPVEAIPRKQDNPDAHLVAQVCSELADYAVQQEGLKSQQGQSTDKVGHAAQLFVLTGGLFSILRVKNKTVGQKQQQGIGPALGYQCDTCDKYVQQPMGEDEPPQFCPGCGNPIEP